MTQPPMQSEVRTHLTEQQLELFEDEARKRSIASSEELFGLALDEFVRQEPYPFITRRFQPASADLSTQGVRKGRPDLTLGEMREELVLRPVSGKALPVKAGEVLRINQVDGEQCVDFNAFSLSDWGERMSVGHSRRQGFRLVEGDVVLSNRHRPLLYIATMPATCVTDLLGARCNGPMFEKKFGFADRKHTNCQDTLAESIREYGLSSDDVHDSFNMWMNTNWDGTGNWWVEWNSGTPTDYVDLLACYDTLCVPVTCGSGDVHPTSNFFLRPIRIQVFEASSESNTTAEEVRKRFEANHAGVRTGPDENSTDRTLQPIEDYKPDFLRYPLQTTEVKIDGVDERVTNGLAAMVRNGWARDLEDATRKSLLLWFLRNAVMNSPHVGGRFRW